MITHPKGVHSSRGQDLIAEFMRSAAVDANGGTRHKPAYCLQKVLEGFDSGGDITPMECWRSHFRVKSDHLSLSHG